MKSDTTDPADHLVAHRGYAAAYPENTVLALGAAVAVGGESSGRIASARANPLHSLVHSLARLAHCSG